MGSGGAAGAAAVSHGTVLRGVCSATLGVLGPLTSANLMQPWQQHQLTTPEALQALLTTGSAFLQNCPAVVVVADINSSTIGGVVNLNSGGDETCLGSLAAVAIICATHHEAPTAIAALRFLSLLSNMPQVCGCDSADGSGGGVGAGAASPCAHRRGSSAARRGGKKTGEARRTCTP